MKLSRIQLGNMVFWYCSDDRVIGQRIALGKYEQYETAILLSQINSNSVVVDVGANIGYYTLLTAIIAKKVYAFEPDKDAFEILKKNVEENNLRNVVLFNKAVGSRNEKKYLIKDQDNFGNSQIQTPQFRQLADQLPLTREPVQVVKLDDVIKERVDLIKIDVQGFEPEVIEGAKKIISKDKPILFLEYSSEDQEMIKFLKNIYENIWSINDFAETPWPIWSGIQIKNNNGYADLWMKNEMTILDYWTMVKNVKYKKFLKGIIRQIWQK